MQPIQIIMIIIIVIIALIFFKEINKLKDNDIKNSKFNEDYDENDDFVKNIPEHRGFFDNFKNENIGNMFSKKNQKNSNDNKIYENELNLADKQYRLQDFNGAKEHINNALLIKRESYSLNKLAHVLIGLGDDKEAKKIYEESISVEPKNSFTLSSYASLLSNMDLYDEAKINYIEALKIEPKNKIINYNYANLLQKLNEFDEALKHYEKALQVDKNFREAKLEMNNLKEKMTNQTI